MEFLLPVLNVWVVIAVSFLLLFISYFIGFSTGKRFAGIKSQTHSSNISSLLTGLIALMGILLAFSFSLSSSRFDLRKQLIIEESLDIGTAYFRVGLLADTALRKEVRSLLKDYVQQRINYYDAGAIEKEMDQYMGKSENIQVRIWMKTAEIGRRSPDINSSLLTQSLNTMIDVSGAISGSMKNHVPALILLMLIAASAFTIFTMGYTHGLSSDKNLWFAMGLNVIICSILFLIVDMDSPFAGLLKINIDALTDLQDQIERYDP